MYFLVVVRLHTYITTGDLAVRPTRSMMTTTTTTTTIITTTTATTTTTPKMYYCADHSVIRTVVHFSERGLTFSIPPKTHITKAFCAA